MNTKSKRSAPPPPRVEDVRELGASAKSRFQAFTGVERRRVLPASPSGVPLASMGGPRRI